MNYVEIYLMLKHIGLNRGITNLTSDCIQPNAVDLKLDRLWKIENDEFYIGENKKKHRSLTELEWDLTNQFQLESDTSYQFETDHFVKIPEGYAGWLIARSTLNRNGIFITSGLYDSGFENYVGGVMHVRCGPARIEKGTRIAQFIYVEAETANMYQGEYNVVQI